MVEFTEYFSDEDVNYLIGEIKALTEELHYCDESEKQIIAGDIRNLKKRVSAYYINKNSVKKENKNADYYRERHNRKLKKLSESPYGDIDDLDLYDDIDLEYGDDDRLGFEYDYDTDDTFYENGNEYRYTDSGIEYQECINGTCWEVAEAKNVETGELVYFVVDGDSGEIDWECETPELAIEFIQGKYDDIDEEEYDLYFDDDDEYYSDDYRMSDADPFDDDLMGGFNEAYDYRNKTTRKPFTVSYANGDSVNTCIVNAKHKDDARDIFNQKLGKRGYRPIDIRNGRLGSEYPDIGMLIDYDDEYMADYEGQLLSDPEYAKYYYDDDDLDLYDETTGVGSIGQHKRSSIDIIDSEEETDRFDIDDSDDYELLIEEDDVEETDDESTVDGEYIELDLSDDTENVTTDDTDELEPVDDGAESDTDTDGNIDGKDSTSPMDNNKPKRTGSNKIDI